MVIFHVHKGPRAAANNYDEATPERLQNVQMEKMLDRKINFGQFGQISKTRQQPSNIWPDLAQTHIKVSTKI